MSLLEQTALSDEGLRGPCAVVHNGGRCSVQVGCCCIQSGISLEQDNKACQVLPDKHEGSLLCVVLIDIDWFKAINDGHDHKVGDAGLEHLSSVCRDKLNPEILIGRTGGEEFLVLLPSVSLETAVRTVDQLRADFPVVGRDGRALDLSYTFSAGLTEAPPQDTKTSILRRADRALYAAKADGRNCIRVRQSERGNCHAVERAAGSNWPCALMTSPGCGMEAPLPTLVARQLIGGSQTLGQPTLA